MISFANAKINIGLFITNKREDGYHDIETVFYPVQLYDVVELNPSSDYAFETYGISIPDGGDNLCTKAYNLLKNDFPHIQEVSIKLLKNIPVGAGLGGGSSDAAFVLKAIKELNALGLDSESLKKYASRLGADCAFFIDNKPVFAKGIGDEFEDVELDLSGYTIVVIKPDIHISTAEAYSQVRPAQPEINLKDVLKLPIQEWKYYLKNDFEDGIFDKYPLIQDLKLKLYERGALYASMSGSGSSVFGIFDEQVNLDDLGRFGKVFYPVEL